MKTAYIDQIRNLDLIGGFFLPNLFDILGVGHGSAFKLDPWVVDEYWLPSVYKHLFFVVNWLILP